jgi:hypothetical protein
LYEAIFIMAAQVRFAASLHADGSERSSRGNDRDLRRAKAALSQLS